MQGYNINQLLQMISAQNNQLQHQKRQIKKIKYQINQFFTKIQEYQQYPESIKALFNQIFYDPDTHPADKNIEIKIDKVLNFPIIKTDMPICNKILIKKQIAFRCYNCMTHEASVICQACFQNGDHKGHRYNQLPSGGGNCDCGNPDAVKQEGFCKNHPGKAEPVQIDQKQFENFQTHFGLLFRWFFRLYEKGQYKSADELGQIIATYLITLNEQSLYYNTLTFKFLYLESCLEPEQILIQKTFEYGIKCVNFAKKMTTLFFSMFSLQIFKYQLTVTYCKVYNKFKDFQRSKFKQLYIQLYANNDLVHRMITTQKLVMNPYNKEYDYLQYIQSLMFISTIKQHVAAEYFAYLMRETIIQFPQLDLIQSSIQKNNSNHLVDILNQHLNKQNSYYSLHQSILKLLKNDENILRIMLENYSNAVLDKKYSYVKNKVVQPFHKILAMIILSIFKGDLDHLDIRTLNQFGLNPAKLQQVCLKVFRLLLRCYGQFALTYLRDTYLDSYIHLYIKSGNKIVVYDQIMFKICLKVFQQINTIQKMNEIMIEIFRFNIKQQKKHHNNLNQMQIEQIQSNQMRQDSIFSNQAENGSNMLDDHLQWFDQQQILSEQDNLLLQEIPFSKQEILEEKIQLLGKNLFLVKLIIENCISNRAEIKISSILQIQKNSKFIKSQIQIISVELLNNFQFLTLENIKFLIANFFNDNAQVEQQFIKKYLIFDKNKRKYIINKQVTLNITKNKLPLSLIPTLKKLGQIFTEDVQKQQNAIIEFTSSKEAGQLLHLFFNPYFLKQIINFFIENLHSMKNNMKVNNFFLDFYETMNILKELMKSQKNQILEQFLNDIPIVIQKQKQFSYLNDKLKEKSQAILGRQKKQLLMKKFNQKKSKRLLQMTKSQSSYIAKQPIQQQQIQQFCLICRQDNQSGLCVFADIHYSNILQILNNAQGRSLSFSSCFHPIHYNCFLKAFKHSPTLPCSLCNRKSNIILPQDKQIENFTLIRQIYGRITATRLSIADKYKGYDKKYEQNETLSILKAITSTIGKHLLENQPILNEKTQKLLNRIYNLITTVFRKILQKGQSLKQIQSIEQFLQILKNKAQQQISTKSNYYACEYLTLKILYLCLSYKSDKCSNVLCESILNLINPEDVRRIWQMCNQLVSLPEFKFRQPKSEFHQQVEQMNTRVDYYQPPRYIKDLIQLRDSKQMSCKGGHQICICIICKKQYCLDCQKLKQHFEQFHCKQGLSFNLMTGGFTYILENKHLYVPSLYYNDVCAEWQPSKSGKGFEFDYISYQQLTDQILKQSLLKYLMIKYPDLVKKTFIMDNFI